MNVTALVIAATLTAPPTVTIVERGAAAPVTRTGTLTSMRYTHGRLAIDFTPLPDVLFRNGFDAK